MTVCRLSTLLFCLLLGASGCSLSGEDEAPTSPQPIDLSGFSRDSTLLVGTWEWQRSLIYTLGGGGFNIYTPESTGDTETLVLTEDITAERYRNGTLERRATYATWRQLYHDEFSSTSFGVRGDTLVTDAMPLDGPQTVYVRVE